MNALYLKTWVTFPFVLLEFAYEDTDECRAEPRGSQEDL